MHTFQTLPAGFVESQTAITFESAGGTTPDPTARPIPPKPRPRVIFDPSDATPAERKAALLAQREIPQEANRAACAGENFGRLMRQARTR